MDTTIEARPSWDEYWLGFAHAAKARSTCLRRKVGAVIVSKSNHILSSGYNGPPSKEQHCNEDPCKGVNFPSGQGLSFCRAVHAEMNALAQVSDIREAYTLYVTASPCIICMQRLVYTPITRIVFSEEYPHNISKDWWVQSRCGREWIHL